jgi:trk system potassium uptake protein TrkA
VVGQFVVIGLGIFGRTVAVNLARSGHSVLAVDLDQREVDRAAPELDSVVRADSTDEQALRELRLERVSCAVVAIGAQAMEASILTTALLRQMGVPRIVARSLSELHARVLRAVGAHEVVSPEEEMGHRLARRLAEPNVLERLELGEDAELVELAAPESFIGKTLVDLNVRQQFGVTVVAVRRAGAVRASLGAGDRLEPGDVLVVIGDPEGASRLAALA